MPFRPAEIVVKLYPGDIEDWLTSVASANLGERIRGPLGAPNFNCNAFAITTRFRSNKPDALNGDHGIRHMIAMMRRVNRLGFRVYPMVTLDTNSDKLRNYTQRSEFRKRGEYVSWMMDELRRDGINPAELWIDAEDFTSDYPTDDTIDLPESYLLYEFYATAGFRDTCGEIPRLVVQPIGNDSADFFAVALGLGAQVGCDELTLSLSDQFRDGTSLTAVNENAWKEYLGLARTATSDSGGPYRDNQVELCRKVGLEFFLSLRSDLLHNAKATQLTSYLEFTGRRDRYWAECSSTHKIDFISNPASYTPA